MTIISISPKTYTRLNKKAIKKNESIDSIINRILELHDQMEEMECLVTQAKDRGEL